ncbi:MAG: flavodoxin family protein [Fusobacteriaceae bacterium]
MKIILHDLESNDFEKLFPLLSPDIKVISNNGEAHHCIGCFGCWVKTPAKCVIKDEYSNMGELLSKCEEYIIISKCYYGGFSPFVKNILDRSISYIHPYFRIINGEMHHLMRYDNILKTTIWFYGENISLREKNIAEELVKRNSINHNSAVSTTNFIDNISELKGVEL